MSFEFKSDYLNYVFGDELDMKCFDILFLFFILIYISQKYGTATL